MNEEIQELINRAICGVIAQGSITRYLYIRESVERETGQPCRCLVGHTKPEPVGAETSFGTLLFKLSPKVADDLFNINDWSNDVDDLRRRLSEYLTAEGCDDSCCWWEVAA